jgi:hypothetical protein
MALGDEQVDILVGIYTRAADEIAELFQEMLFISSSHRARAYRQILVILQRLRTRASDWARTEIDRVYREADQRIIRELSVAENLADLETAFSRVHEQAVEALVKSMLTDLRRAEDSVKSLASKISRRSQLPPGLDAETRRQVAIGLASGDALQGITPRVRTAIRNQFRDDLVTIIGNDGRIRHFSLDYYADLVARTTTRQAMTLATINRAEENDYDLVRVSPNPSTIPGCYCNFYAGRVFSISGDDPRFPYLGDTPNGGPPFHPHCLHSIHVFVERFYSEEEMLEYGDVPDELLLQSGETNQGRILRAATQRLEANPSAADLENV